MLPNGGSVCGLAVWLGVMAATGAVGQAAEPTAEPLRPFAPDAHTRLLYHLDEGSGTVVHDASGRGQDAVLKGAEWAPGRFGGGLWFNGTDASAFLERPDGLYGLRQVTVECWFNPEAAAGRRFLVGHDVGFHFEVDDAAAMSVSLYNQGGGVPNAEGKPHQQVLLGGVQVRSGRWHHLAITYDGQTVSYFLDGTLRGRRPGPRDFALGAPSRGLWLGCYVGTDYWFSGVLDEVRVSDCVRYDPEGKLTDGQAAFAMPDAAQPLRPPPAVRTPEHPGTAALKLALRKRHGDPATGWVCVKPPDRPAVVVGEYRLAGEAGAASELTLDASDALAGDGPYLIALVPTSAGYFAVTAAELTAGGRTLGTWSGEANSRWTFRPPLLLALRAAAPPPPTPAPAARRLFLPAAADWASGRVALDTAEVGQPPVLTGDGAVEWWFDLPAAATYRVHLRYAAAAPTPCDIVLDGNDLNAFDMGALNTTGRVAARDAFWEYQGTVSLGAGPHWLRLQDVLPDIVAVRFEPTAQPPPAAVPWARSPVPEPDALGTAGPWYPQPLFGRAAGVARATRTDGRPALTFSADFANTDPAELFAGDALRFTLPVTWDLEPYGRLRVTVQGTASQHVASLWAVDAKGDEKLLWRWRDHSREPLPVAIPLDFEGNDVFDPGRVAAIALDLDEGNVRTSQINQVSVTLLDPVFERRDALSPAADYAPRLAAARQALRDQLRTARTRPPALVSPGFHPWTRPVVPEEHPLFATTEPKPVTRQTLGYDLHATGARDIAEQALRNFHTDYDFGDVCWPHIGILPQRRNVPTDEAYRQALAHLESRLQEVRQRGLILFDIWGYVPNGEAGPTPKVTPEHHEILLRVLGDRFTGYDNGEQDGRYIGGYAPRGAHTNRREGWDDFVRWDQGICSDSMNYMNAIGSLNFSHYYGERGCRTLGLETAQGLPSDTLMFAFLRGAGKQYGRLTTQATSIWNRFGYNLYHDRKTDGPRGYGLGPHKGCSLSLHRRLFFQSYTGGDSIVGSETGQFTADRLETGAPELSPLGRQHLDIVDWVRRHPQRGVLYTPVAFLMDFHNGWNMPRHLYRGDRYKIWGKFDYEKGDYLADAVFRLVWPGYQDASYLRNERGFVTPTPYGDLFDVVTNRCHPDVLRQYAAILLLGPVEFTPQEVANLTAFVAAGGDLLLDAGNARAFPAQFAGLTLGAAATACASGRPGTRDAWDEAPYTYTVAQRQTATALLVNEAGHPLLTVNRSGQGRVIVCLADQWLTDPLTYADPKLVNMEPPYRLLDGLRATLDEYFASFSPVTADPPGLNLRVSAYGDDPNRLLVTLTNNELFADWQGQVRLRSGKVAAVRDLRRAADLHAGRDAVGVTVPAGDVVVLDLRLK